MQDEEIIEKLREIFKLVNNKNIDVSKIKADSNITTDLGLDSVGLIYIAIAIEKIFNIDMEDANLNTFKTVGDVVKFIEERV